MKKIISLTLITVFMLTALVSCTYSDDLFREDYGVPTGPNSTVPTEEDSGSPTIGIPPETGTGESAVPQGLNFEGYELVVLVRNDVNVQREWVTPDGYGYESNLLVDERNDNIEQQMNLKVKVEVVNNLDSWGNWMTDFNTTLLEDINGSQRYDVYSHSVKEAAALKIRGCQANLLNEEVFPYFDFSMPVWNKSIVDQAIGNKLFYVAGAMNTSMYDNTVVTWYSKTVYDKYKTADDPDDMLDAAKAGKFTYDVFYKWAELCEVANSDNPCDNIYGVSYHKSSFYDAIPYAWGLELVTTNADGTHSVDILNNQKANNVISDLRDFRVKKGVSNCQEKFLYGKEIDGIVRHFADEKSVFMINTLNTSEHAVKNEAIRDMSSIYGILPLPKYYESDEYKTTVVGDFSLYSAVNHPSDIIRGEAVSAFMQRATEKSSKELREEYIGELIMPRFFGGPAVEYARDNVDFISEIIDTAVFDISSIYGAAFYEMSWHLGSIVENNKGSLDSTGEVIDGYTLKSLLRVWEDDLAAFDSYIHGDE